MMNDDNQFGRAAVPPDSEPTAAAEDPARATAADAPGPAPAPAVTGSAADAGTTEAAAPPAPSAPVTNETSAAVLKFKACRWRCDPDDGEFCTHRDVLPYAGKEGFSPDSWCPECAFYKLRRTPKKRERMDYTY
ncbi:hypothetical protein BH23ACI1_BH23ACI1_22070 [soil metagenome]